jgi:protein-S-isoprenylcysteine O-methyltransferase Ste14
MIIFVQQSACNVNDEFSIQLPTNLTMRIESNLLALVLGVVLIQIQVRLEEEHLKALHGGKYEEYRCRVRRWV